MIIKCYKNHDCKVIEIDDNFYGAICYDCNTSIIQLIECTHEIRRVIINKRNDSKEIRDMCIKCFNNIKTIKKSDIKEIEYSLLPLKDIELLDAAKYKMYESLSEKRKNIQERLENIKNGINKIERNKYYQSPEWKAIRIPILERDKYLCQGCLKNKATDVHHIDYKNLYNEFMFELISLCRECHNRFHNK